MRWFVQVGRLGKPLKGTVWYIDDQMQTHWKSDDHSRRWVRARSHFSPTKGLIDDGYCEIFEDPEEVGWERALLAWHPYSFELTVSDGL